MGIRQFFDAAQEALESGGRQHDSGGNPLVGRYRDGTTPKGDKKAYGAGQMQIGTARNTANAHGIPWDENKFLNDKEYNLTLADAHKGDLLRKYKGNRAHADAAYHSGEPIVDRAIAKYGESGFVRGLGPEGRNYVRRLSESRGGKKMANAQDFLQGLESSLAPEVAASGNVSQNAGAVFNSDKRVNQETDKVRTNLEKQTGTIAVLDAVTQAAQSQQIESAQSLVTETRQISDTMTQANQELQKKIKPVFEARARVADQLDKINTMNPLERGIRGIFDLNYDREYMTNQLDNFDRTLKMRAEDYKYLGALQADAIGEIERRYNLDNTMTGLAVTQAKEDMTLAGLELANSQGFLATSMGQINDQAQIIAAKASARRDMMGQLDQPTILNLMTQAETNGGFVDHNGTRLSHAELREVADGRERQAWATEGYKLGIASQRQAFAEKSAEDIMQYASRDQLEKWIADGGVATMPDGTKIPLPQDKLTHYLTIHRQRELGMAEDIAAKIPAAQAVEFTRQQLGQTAQIFQRAQGFFTPGTPQDSQMGQAIQSQRAAFKELQDAVASGQPQTVINALTQKANAASENVRGVLDNTILMSVGGDKQSARYVSAFVTGVELNDAEAAGALVHFALKGGMPEQLKASPEARQVFADALKIVSQNRLDDKGKPRSAESLKQIVTDQVLSSAGSTVGQAKFERFFTELPDRAREDGNPLGRLNRETWATIQIAAEREAAADMAVELKTTPQAVLHMVRTGKPLSDAPAHKRTFESLMSPAGAQSWNAKEQGALVEQLDGLPALSPGISNSKLLVNYLQSKQVRDRMARTEQYSRQSSFGDYVLGPAVRGNFERRISSYAQVFDNSRAAVYQDASDRARQFDRAYAKNPGARIQVILSSIDGVGGAGAKALLPVIQSKIGTGAQILDGVVGAVPGMQTRGVVQLQEERAKEILLSMKFDDPRLEGYRKAAIRGWEESATQTGTFTENMLDALRAGPATLGM